MSSIYSTDPTEAMTRFTDEEDAPEGELNVTLVGGVPPIIETEMLHDEDDENDEDESYINYGRTSTFLSIGEAYELLADEYLQLMDSLEEIEDMLDRRMSEKSRLTQVLMSKEEEYTERKDRLERMLARIEKLETKLLDRMATQSPAPATEGMLKMLEHSKTETLEALNNASAVLKKHQGTNRKLIQTLRNPIAFEERDVQLYLQRATHLDNVEELEEELVHLQREVNQLRSKQRAEAKAALLGSEIIIENDNDVDAISIGPLTCYSSDYR